MFRGKHGSVGPAEGCDGGVSGEMLRSLRQLLQNMHFSQSKISPDKTYSVAHRGDEASAAVCLTLCYRWPRNLNELLQDQFQLTGSHYLKKTI
ncbi:hypothetical protein QCD79_00425 [Pseudomonas quasicaspiana]|nr:hypothetical protein [Pseudomonas quasicaspiana]